MADDEDHKHIATAKEHRLDPPGMAARPSLAEPGTTSMNHNAAVAKWQAEWLANRAAAERGAQGPDQPPGGAPPAAAAAAIPQQQAQAAQADAERPRPDLLQALLQARPASHSGLSQDEARPADELARLLLGPRENQKAPAMPARDDLATTLQGERKPEAGRVAGSMALRDSAGKVMDDY